MRIANLALRRKSDADDSLNLGGLGMVGPTFWRLI